MTPSIIAGSIKTHLGNYGQIPYGHTIVGRLHYPVSNRDGCSPLHRDDFSLDIYITRFVIFDHGGCSNVLKTKHAQEFGFKAAILIDDEAQDEVSLRETESNSAKYLNIPLLKIFGTDGAKLTQYL